MQKHVPDYQRVAGELRDQIRSGQRKPGDKLPTKRQLIETYKVSGQVIDSAMMVLKIEGWVRGHQGRGVYVAEPRENERSS